MPAKPKDHTGKRYGRLIACRLFGRNQSGLWLWECLCDCGTIAVVTAAHLASGNCQSCGCLRTEHNQRIARFPRKIPGVMSVLVSGYRSWKAMNRRCTKPADTAYARYGGRGITVCDRWRVFKNFLNDMGPRPSTSHSIERRKNDEGYFPENCYWATSPEQTRNKRSNHVISFDGKTHCLADWAAIMGMKRETLQCRLNRYGWPTERALTEPVRKWT
jgi:hypothetical protein